MTKRNKVFRWIGAFGFVVSAAMLLAPSAAYAAVPGKYDLVVNETLPFDSLVINASGHFAVVFAGPNGDLNSHKHPGPYSCPNGVTGNWYAYPA